MSRIDRYSTIKLAAATPCDPRTARAYLAGRAVRGDILRARLAEAARDLGLVAQTDPTPSEAAKAA